MKHVILGLCCCLFAGSAFAQSTPVKSKGADNMRVLIETPKPYGPLALKIEQLGGVVHHRYEHIDAIAATVPGARLNDVAGLEEAGVIVEDRIITLGVPRTLERQGFGAVSAMHESGAGAVQGVVADFVSTAPDGYSPTEAALTRALDFWVETGNLGEDVIIGIMDSGLREVPALGSRIVGGENFVPVAPALDDGIPAVSNANDPHGTHVATTAGANAGMCFLADHPWAVAIGTHLPEAVTPDGCGPGVDLIPMVGQAPAAEFFALKIFNVDSRTSTSIILAAFDRAIELKEQYDSGGGGVNIRVLNGSFGGATLFAAEDPFFAGMIKRVEEAGIVTVFSAGNNGPSGITGGDPGTARHTLTVGATSVPSYERILRDVQFGPGVGALFRPNNLHQTAYFSSRGPTADGRTDPDITAPGFAIFTQAAGGSVSLVSGTSFSAPQVAGAAALLLSAHPDATPEEIRGALLAGADPHVLEDGSGPFDQGHGFLDVMSAYQRFGTPPPPDQGQANKNVKVNVQKLGVDVISSRSASRATGWLLPGERAEYFVETKATDAAITVQVSVTSELPPSQQNQLFSDDAFVQIQSAKTSLDDYVAGGFVPGVATFTLGPDELEEGLVRVTVSGDWTNAGRIHAVVHIATEKMGLAKSRPINGSVTENEWAEHALLVAPGTSELNLLLDWASDWSEWPTDDLDLYLLDPDGVLVPIFDAATLNAPERMTIQNPAPGNWTLLVDGFTVWSGTEKYQIIADAIAMNGKQSLLAGPLAARADRLEGEYMLSEAHPNPARLDAQFTLQVAQDQQVRIEVFNVLGQRVALVHDGVVTAGEKHAFRLEASALPGGMYFYHAAGETFRTTRQIMLVK